MEDDKFDGISPAAGWLWVGGLCYANFRLTDGRLVGPRALDRIKMSTGIYQADSVIAELVERNLWKPVDGGYEIVNYAKYQKTKERYEHDLEMGRQRSQSFYDRHLRPQPPPPNSGVSTDDANPGMNGVRDADSNGVRYRGSKLDPIDLEELRSRRSS